LSICSVNLNNLKKAIYFFRIMAKAISKFKVKCSIFIMLVVAVELLYLYGILCGLLIFMLNMVLGYFYADFRIAINHFLMDNYYEHSSGFRHHAAVAKIGFDEGRAATDVKKEYRGTSCEPCDSCTPCDPCYPCGPCDPCSPCAPDPGPMMNMRPIMNMRRVWIAVYIISPFLPLPGFGILFLMLELMNDLSGAGLPDYWSHHRNEAPYLAKVAQDFRLLMSESDHYKHHVNPKIGYAYFSPITNILLEKISFWEFSKWIMLKIYKKQPLTIPAMSKN